MAGGVSQEARIQKMIITIQKKVFMTRKPLTMAQRQFLTENKLLTRSGKLDVQKLSDPGLATKIVKKREKGKRPIIRRQRPI